MTRDEAKKYPSRRAYRRDLRMSEAIWEAVSMHRSIAETHLRSELLLVC